MSAEIQEPEAPYEERKYDPQLEPKYEGSPETRYMGLTKDELETSPYDKNISHEEIQERINQSLQLHHDSVEEPAKAPMRTAKTTVRTSPQRDAVKRDGSMESADEIQPSSLTPTKNSLYRINHPPQEKPKSSPKQVLSKEIYDEFDLNSSYSQKLLNDAHNTGIRNLATTAMRSESPFRYSKGGPQRKEAQPTGYKKSPDKSTSFQRYAQSNIPAGPPNASQEILSRVFDGNLSVHSPSKKMQEEMERRSLTPSKMDMFVDDKLKTTNTILERFVDLSASKANISRRAAGQSRGVLEEAFEAAIESLGKPESNITPEDEIIKLAACINSTRKDVKLGGIIGCYVIWRTFPNEISAAVIDHILQNVFTQLIHYESQDEAFLIAALELVGFFGPNEISCNSVSVIRGIFCAAEAGTDLQVTCTNTLVMLGYAGLQVLIEIANKDYQQLQQVILSRLCSVPFIQVELRLLEIIIETRVGSSTLG